MFHNRLQLTLFINKAQSEEIEKIRTKFNPRQFELIDSHVTLCWDKEMDAIEEIRNNLKNLNDLNLGKITIDFGKVARSADGLGVLLPAIGSNKSYQELRKIVLGDFFAESPNYQPHITLIHPRNSTCTDEIFRQIQQCTFPERMQFNKISLIEQKFGEKWHILEEFEFS